MHNVSETNKQKEALTDGRFDIVVHDCFSGGSVPAHLYTQRFWQELKDIVTADAVVAVVSMLSAVLFGQLLTREAGRTLQGCCTRTLRQPSFSRCDLSSRNVAHSTIRLIVPPRSMMSSSTGCVLNSSSSAS